MHSKLIFIQAVIQLIWSQKTAHPATPTDASKLWLRTKLLDFPRYSQFRENQHRRQLQNFDILEDWNFAAQVYHQFYKTVCDATVSLLIPVLLL